MNMHTGVFSVPDLQVFFFVSSINHSVLCWLGATISIRSKWTFVNKSHTDIRVYLCVYTELTHGRMHHSDLGRAAGMSLSLFTPLEAIRQGKLVCPFVSFKKGVSNLSLNKNQCCPQSVDQDKQVHSHPH